MNPQTQIELDCCRLISESKNDAKVYIQSGRRIIERFVKKCVSIESYVKVNEARLNSVVANFLLSNKEELNQILQNTIEYNYKFADFYSALLMSRTYLLSPYADQEPFETPCIKNMRIAAQLYSDDFEKMKEMYYDLCEGYYTLATPSILNAGTKNPQMFSCFLTGVADNLESILFTMSNCGMISKSNGGIGCSLSMVRNGVISNSGKSSGILPIMNIFDKIVNYVDQGGGKRKGAATIFLDATHIDLFDFIDSVNNFGPHANLIKTLNTCVWMRPLLYEFATQNKDWLLFSPEKRPDIVESFGLEFEEKYTKFYSEILEIENNIQQAELLHSSVMITDHEEYQRTLHELVQAKKKRIPHNFVPASSIVKRIADTQIQCGMPFIMNADACNFKSNHKNLGAIMNSNLCLEIVQKSGPERIASCNLSSINLARYVIGEYQHTNNTTSVSEKLRTSYDFNKLGEMVRKCVRNLEEAVNRNAYPSTSRVKSELASLPQTNFDSRPIGIGVSGFDDAIKMCDLIYESEEVVIFNKMIFACMYFNALAESVEIAKELGSYSEFKDGGFFSYFEKDSKLEKEYLKGSPFANGLLQFDLWKQETLIHKHTNRLSKDYIVEDDEPIDPEVWGQQAIHGLNSWSELKETIRNSGIRNSLLLALMPTATTSQVFQNAESTECHQYNIYERNLSHGTILVINRHMMSDLEKLGIYDSKVLDFIYHCNGTIKYLPKFIEDFYPDKYIEIKDKLDFFVRKHKTMFEISQKYYMTLARQRGIYIDQSQSLSLFLKDPTLSQRKAIQKHGLNQRLKTVIYYLRMASSQESNSFDKNPEMIKYISQFPDFKNNSTVLISSRDKTEIVEEQECMACGS